MTALASAEAQTSSGCGPINGAQRQRRMIDAGASPAEVYAASVRETHATYLQEEPVP